MNRSRRGDVCLSESGISLDVTAIGILEAWYDTGRMADTTSMNRAEAFVRLKVFGPKYSARRLLLRWGGNFAFDAVSPDGKTVALISTSAARTAGGNLATGKIKKLIADALFLIFAARVKRRVMVFTERSMFAEFRKYQEAGRFPPGIELIHFPLPRSHRERVRDARLVSRRELGGSDLT